MSARYARRIDDNARVIVNALRAFGCTVVPIQGAAGTPDLLVGLFGLTELVEVKPLTGVTARRELRESQEQWHTRWRGRKPVVVRTLQDCEALVSRLRGAMASGEHPTLEQALERAGGRETIRLEKSRVIAMAAKP